MARDLYALERHRDVDGGLVERWFGPASPASQRSARTLRRTLYPMVNVWRPTHRGIWFARRVFDPGPTLPLVRGTTVERRVVGGRPVEWTVAPRARGVDEHQRVLLYLHGGGYFMGSPRTHRNLVSRLSQATGTPVASVDYRMVPEASIQASQADAMAAYRGLLDLGCPSEAIVLAGDSAGGGLAAHVALAAIDAGLPSPAGLVLLSPWLDLTAGGPSRTANESTEFFIAGDVLNRVARAIVPDELERAHWRNSPINAPAEALAKLPPVLVQVGAAEVLADDGIAFARRIGAAGGTAELQSFDGQGHVVAIWAGNPDARRALKEIAGWLMELWPDHREPTEPTAAELDAAVATDPSGRGPTAFPG